MTPHPYAGAIAPTVLTPALPDGLTLGTSAAIADWLAARADDAHLVHVEREPARLGSCGGLARPFPDHIAAAVPAGGLYAHQARAIDLIRDGHSVVIATGTASGKSLAFQLPIAEAVTAPVRPGTSLLLYPTKALAQDQLRSFTDLGIDGVVAGAYDGDASTEERTWIRERANVVLTNPEMLHGGLLPSHKKWAMFLGRLTYVVIDELHVLRGVFGSHVAHVLRRLARLSALYGGNPTFVFTSATIGEPGRLATELCGRPVTEITDDRSPRGPRSIALWQPNPDPGTTKPRSTTGEATRVAASLIEAGLSTVVFCRSRRSTEIVANALRQRLGGAGAERIRAYRSGYLPAERREIEAALAAGELDAVVATNALELGVDIAGLDAVVLCGFPGTVASMWQQIGRAGRRGDESVSVVVAGDDQLDQWVMAHPAETFARPPERAVVNVSNPLVVDAHIACAAYERFLHWTDGEFWGDDLDAGVRRGVRDDWLAIRRRRDDAVAVWSGRGWPASQVGLRSSSRREFRIVDVAGELIGTIDGARAFEQTHPGAIYLHQGRALRVDALDIAERKITVSPADGDTYTQANSTNDVAIIATGDHRPLGRAIAHVGEVEVTHQVVGYTEKRVADHRVVASERLELPADHLVTTAVWYTLTPELLADAGLDPHQVGGALHAIEHAAIGILPLFAICDRWDVGGLSTPMLAGTGLPTIVIHDAYAGGAGVAALAFDAVDRHLAATLSVIERCGCERGCPSCVQSPKCGNGNEPLDKAAAAAVLRTILHR